MIKISTTRTNQLLATVLVVIAFGYGLCDMSAQVIPGQTESKENKEIREQALQLINRPEPKFRPNNSEISRPSTIVPNKSKQRRFKMKDGKYLNAYSFGNKKSRTTIVLLHGVLSSADKMSSTASMLSQAADASVLAIDLRGHGRSDGTPGDVDHIDQYAEDVAQIIRQVRKDSPKNKVILAGHSMGGGIGLRFAMLKEHPSVDGFLLLAPLLGQNSPTLPQPTGKSISTEEPFLKIHVERLIGLKMLNSVGEHQYDNLNILFFNVPPEAPIKAYSYRANESMAPVDYAAGLKVVKEPLLVLVGSKDEAFTASEFENAVRSNSKGEVFVIDGVNHNGITQDPKSTQLIKEWISTKVGVRTPKN